MRELVVETRKRIKPQTSFWRLTHGEKSCILPLTWWWWWWWWWWNTVMDLYTSQKGHRIQVDESDLPKLEGYSLTVQKDRRGGSLYGYGMKKVNGRWKNFNLGRLILGLEKGDKREAEHVNPNDTLDYRRSNLRIATRAQNNRNRRMRKDNTSGYKGVVVYRGGFRAQIMVNGRGIALGTRPTKEEAFELYCAAAKKYHKDFARPERRIET